VLADYRIVGEDLWGRFNGGRDGTLWYYRQLVEAFRASALNRPGLLAEIVRTVDEVERLARGAE
ncbi:MAG: phosphohydrolase, partial [Myxococcota bacterium]